MSRRTYGKVVCASELNSLACKQHVKDISSPSRRRRPPMKTPLLAAALAITQLIAGSTQLSATPLCDSLATGGYDIVYICPSAWRAEVQRLGLHRAQGSFGGYSSIIAPTETLATCFGPGRSGVRAMLHQALQSWSTPPKHVVLVGAYGEFDTTVNIIPAWYIQDPTIGFWPEANYQVATDDFYVVAPGSSNYVPVASIGRIPVWELEGLHNYIDKLISYEQQDLTSWKVSSLHIIDDRDLDGNSGYLARQRADSLAETVIAGRESYFTRSFLYASSSPPIQNLPILQAWNAGIGFVLGYGTGGDQLRIAQLTANWQCVSPTAGTDSLLANNKTPVVLAMTCGGGYASQGYRLPNNQTTCCSLHQYLLGSVNKGAVSITGPTRAIRETAAYAIAREWLRTHFGAGPAIYGEPGSTLRAVKSS